MRHPPRLAPLALWLSVSLAGGIVMADEPPASPPLVPFVLPWDDASGGVTNVSRWLDPPAGKAGHVTAGRDGRFCVAGKRIRFLGVNLCFGACFPAHADAEKIAARLARFGVNCVRFHHMDTSVAPNGLLRADGKTFDADRLDRLDYLIAQLKKQGIYTNLNLHVGRAYPGFAKWDGMPGYHKGLDNFMPGMIQLQKDYACDLLTHVNPYTKTRYADEPAVAFVEINNENGLIHEYLSGKLDEMPEAYAAELARQWNDWLKAKHRDDAALKLAWAAGEEPLGDEMLTNGTFADGLKGWNLEQHGAAKAQAQPVRDGPQGRPAVQVQVQALSTEAWHVQLACPKLAFEQGKSYTVSFQARAEKPQSIQFVVAQERSPWKHLWSHPVRLSDQWQRFTFTFSPLFGEKQARIVFSSLAGQLGSLFFADVSVRPGGILGLRADEKIGQVAILRKKDHASRTVPAQRDWFTFMWETERDYWQGMQRYVKQDLGCKALVVGTIVGCSTPTLMAGLDAVDVHGYWQHPRFPGRPWDPANWTVENVSMVNSPGGVPANMALRRVFGKPLVCTEYNHPAPNTFGGEAPLLLAAIAALQDWDGVFLFSYCHRRDDWNARKIPNFFDIDQHPTKMANLPIAAALFARGDVQPAGKLVAPRLGRADEIELLRTQGRPWGLVHAGTLGVPSEAALLHRVGLRVGTVSAEPDAASLTDAPEVAGRKAFTSDNGQVNWDLSRPGKGVVTVQSPRTRAVVGFVDGRHFELGDVTFAPGATRQDWCTLAATLIEGESFKGPARVLIVATGYAENVEMGWKDERKNTVGRDWGKPPSRVEVVPARITLPVPAGRVAAWVLDERGQRGEPLRPQPAGDNAVIELTGGHRTLWYEIEIR